MTITNESVVSMHYELKDAQNGDILDSNKEGAPLAFIVGKGQIIPGLESQMHDMKQGENKKIIVPSKEAYGEYDESALQTLPKEQFAGIELTQGMTLFGQGAQGESVQVTVKDFTDSEVTVDFNHPLAGKDLLFDVSIAEVREATADELQAGVVGGGHSCCGGGSCGSHEHSHGHEHGKDHECCGGAHHNEDGSNCCGSH